MTYPTADEFAELLLGGDLATVLRQHVFEGTPYVYRTEPGKVEFLYGHLSSALGCGADCIRIVGSARIGFSLAPDTFPRRFTDNSDVDVIVVDEQAFDEIWSTVLKWHYPRRYGGLWGVDRAWAGNRKRDVYWGWFRPDAIRFTGLSRPRVLNRLLEISTLWFNAFRALGLHPGFEDRDFSGRLYRSWDHASFYHLEGLRQIRARLAAST